ncbi:MAG: glycerophosphodiester phosphodiesterase family protein [Pseudomonadota bacterium]
MRALLVGLCIVAALVWANNTRLFAPEPPDHPPRFIAHRGVHQTFAGGTPGPDTCTANPVAPIKHPYIENTLPSMRAAFALGAEIVELDVHLTPDGVFAVFHDWTLDCRTDGTGQTNKQDFASLRALDVGHGYSVDGQNHPLRGKGIGLMPRLEEVFAAFPDRRFLINFKSDRQSEGRAMVDLLTDDPDRQAQVFGVYGAPGPSQVVSAAFPSIRGFDRDKVSACLLRYAALGWIGHVPPACRNTVVIVPQNVAPFLWGWPVRFQQRLDAAGTTIILAGSYRGGGGVRGIDSRAALARVPDGFTGYVWTNDLPALTGRRPAKE